MSGGKKPFNRSDDDIRVYFVPFFVGVTGIFKEKVGIRYVFLEEKSRP